MQLPDLARLADPGLVVRIPARGDRIPLLDRMADLVAAAGGIDPAAFRDAIHHREAVASTAIGNHAAVPHARVQGLAACRMAVATAPAGIDWNAPDGLPVHLVVMLALRECDHAEHLRLLAALASRLRDTDRVRRIVAAAAPDGILAELTAPA